jgi:hypothetical protein
MSVIKFPGITRLELNPDDVLDAAKGQLDLAIVIGVTPEGNFYFASSEPDGAEVVWWLERTKHKLMQLTDDLEEGIL